MELRVLRYFLAVVREGGISRAAEALHITQPTLSRQLAQLEEEVGVRLFYRGARQITLTDGGLLLKRRAEEILALVDRTELELTKQDEQVEGQIVIGGGELAAMQTLAEILASFHAAYPLVRYDLFTGAADLILEQMEKGLIDIGVLLEPVDMEKFDFIRLPKTERWGVLMRPDNPLARQDAVSASDLLPLPLIFPRRGNVQSELASWFGDSFSQTQALFTGNLSTNGALMVQKGLACSIVIEGSMPFCDPDALVFRPLTPPLTAGSVFAWKRHQPSTVAVTRFIEFVRCFLGMGEG